VRRGSVAAGAGRQCAPSTPWAGPSVRPLNLTVRRHAARHREADADYDAPASAVGKRKGRTILLFMIVERYRPGVADRIYQRVRERGRMMPPGLEYVDSWVTMDVSRCFQLMRTDNQDLLAEWMSAWSDLIEFEVTQVQSSAEAAASAKAQ